LVPVLRSDGGGQRLIIQASDVTTWKQERDELQRKSETIQALIQAGRSATADTDNDSVLDEFVLYAVKMRQLSSRLLQPKTTNRGASLRTSVT
jgi:hypothetical protein